MGMRKQKMIFSLSDIELPEIGKVGGKARTLMELLGKGFNVPDGIVIGTDFFTPWIDGLKASSSWGSDWNSIRKTAQSMSFSEDQISDLEESLRTVKGKGIYAVRSSSPEEDQKNLSFAGVYETTLGVKPEDLQTAVLHCFSSLFEERVIEYKTRKGISLENPSMAVVIQRQLSSEVSGVAFSVNPVTNSYDDILINSNFGLGDTIVDGLVEADTVIVDKTNGRIKEKIPGKKQYGHLLEKGVLEKRSGNPDFSLNEVEISRIADLTTRVESHIGLPVDIEWAYENENLFLLQARPVTGIVLLPPPLVTAPGEQKKLYMDGTLTEQGLVQAISPLGEGIFTVMAVEAVKPLGADDKVVDTLLIMAAGRGYNDLGRTMKLSGKKFLIKSFEMVDARSVELIQNLDLEPYVPQKYPWTVIRIMLKTSGKASKAALIAIRAFNKSEQYLEYFLEESKKLEEGFYRDFEAIEDLDTLSRKLLYDLGTWLNFVSLPTLYASLSAKGKLKKMFKREGVEFLDKLPLLERAFPHNITIEMGEAIYNLAHSSEIKEISDEEEFLEKLENGELSDEFIGEWNQFMNRFGFRCPREMDVATPRYMEQPGTVFRLLKITQEGDDPELTPPALFARGAKVREETYELFLGKCRNSRERKQFKKRYKVLESFTAYREIHKYYLIMAMSLIRKRILKQADDLVASGRLDHRDDIFQLYYPQLIEGLKDYDLDLRRLRDQNKAYFDRYRIKVDPPAIIDSRGFIPRPKRKEDGIKGVPASPGVVSGPVRVLSRPDEKPVHPGEILVAEATDPGWTPLFLNAAGILIQNGGVLQHGASVARESCKPCIVGLSEITHTLKDGQIVEMDGSTGVVKVIGQEIETETQDVL